MGYSIDSVREGNGVRLRPHPDSKEEYIGHIVGKRPDKAAYNSGDIDGDKHKIHVQIHGRVPGFDNNNPKISCPVTHIHKLYNKVGDVGAHGGLYAKGQTPPSFDESKTASDRLERIANKIANDEDQDAKDQLADYHKSIDNKINRHQQLADYHERMADKSFSVFSPENKDAHAHYNAAHQHNMARIGFMHLKNNPDDIMHAKQQSQNADLASKKCDPSKYLGEIKDPI